jgi:hypothetical protein
MQAEGTLTLFANLSVVFAGFAGLVGTLGKDTSSSTKMDQQNEARVLVEFCCTMLIASVLPLVLWNAGLDEIYVWRVASAYAAVQIVIYHFLRLPELKKAWTGSAGIFWAGMVPEWFFAVVLVLGAANFFPAGPAPVYLSFLLWNLVGTALSFIRLVRPIWLNDA